MMKYLKKFENYSVVNEGLIDWVKSLFHTDEDEVIGEGILNVMKNPTNEEFCSDFDNKRSHSYKSINTNSIITFKFNYEERTGEEGPVIQKKILFITIITQQGQAAPKDKTKVSISASDSERFTNAKKIELNLSNHLANKIKSTAISLCKKEDAPKSKSQKDMLRSELIDKFKK